MSQRVGVAVLAAILVVAAALVFFFLVDVDESAGPNEGVTLQEVIDSPDEFAGQEVTVSGQVSPTEYLSMADADHVFVIGDNTSGRVLVYPQPEAALPDGFGRESVVRVTGRVRPIGAGTDDEQVFVDEARLMSGSGAAAVIDATGISVPGGDLDETPNAPPTRRALVSQLIRDPEAWDEVALRVGGTVRRIGDTGFVLEGRRGDAAIFVGAPHSELSGLQEGQEVEIRADLQQLSPYRAETVRAAVRGAPDTEVDEPDSLEYPAGEGEPFLLLRTLESAADPGS